MMMAVTMQYDPEDGVNVRLDRLTRTLNALIVWTAQSANAPLSGDDAIRLLDMLEGRNAAPVTSARNAKGEAYGQANEG